MDKGPGAPLLQPEMENTDHNPGKTPKTPSPALSLPSPLPSLFLLFPLTAELNLR